MTLTISQTPADQMAELFSHLFSASPIRNGSESVTSGNASLPVGAGGTANHWTAEGLLIPIQTSDQIGFVFGFTTSPLAYIQLVGDPTSAHESDFMMAALAYAAEEHNEAAFLSAYRQMDWTARPADDFFQATQWALAAGAHGLARPLAQNGAERYPEHEELQRYAQVLAPPRVIRRDLPPRSDLRANRDWMMQQGDAYQGQWVALHNGQLLASASSLDELIAQVPRQENVFMTRVF